MPNHHIHILQLFSSDIWIKVLSTKKEQNQRELLSFQGWTVGALRTQRVCAACLERRIKMPTKRAAVTVEFCTEKFSGSLVARIISPCPSTWNMLHPSVNFILIKEFIIVFTNETSNSELGEIIAWGDDLSSCISDSYRSIVRGKSRARLQD